MAERTIFKKMFYLKDKVRNADVNDKKIKALANYSQAAQFDHNDFLLLIKKCVGIGFLNHEEGQFLTYMLNKYELNFLEWCYKNKWLRRQIYNLANENVCIQNKKAKDAKEQKYWQDVLNFVEKREEKKIDISQELFVADEEWKLVGHYR